MTRAQAPRPALWGEIRGLLYVALAILVYVVVIGILNGADVVNFDRKRILSHVHAGTLGWITMGVLAATLWLFGEGRPLETWERVAARWLSWFAVVTFPLSIIAFALTYGDLRPVTGILALATILGFFFWALARTRGNDLSVPHVGFLVALATSLLGGVLGTLWGIEIATGRNLIPTGGEDAHPATMVVGFLIPVGLAMAEWGFNFPRPPKASKAGVIQMVFPFLGGVIISIALLTNVDPLNPLAVLLEVIGVAIFLARLWPSFRTVDWLSADAGRHSVFTTVAIVFTIGLVLYFVIRYKGDFDLVPMRQIIAMDHSNFVGVMTNALLAMLLMAPLGAGKFTGRRWQILDHLVFVGLNAGLVLFIIGLMGDWAWPKRLAAPAMGAALLIGIGLAAVRLAEPLTVSEQVPEQEPGSATA